MRAIKFRGKRVDNGEWVYGNLILCGKAIIRWAHNPLTDDYTDIEIDPETVGQFTGLADKSGKEIYEGDFIKPKQHKTRNDDVYVVGYKIGGFSLDRITDGKFCSFGKYFDDAVDNDVFGNVEDCDGSVFEVIGNIHDNPQLIEGGNK